ncbi:MAG: LamG domain-containing protein [Saprospiraceae bacterium]|nr:LamG domain-containing protein [Saprospiraceae bacterium]
MRKCLFLIFMIVSNFIVAQSPQGINYQAAVRKTDGKPIVNKDIKVRVNILNESSTGNIVYREEHTAVTSTLGLINLTIGEGYNKSGQFENIEWGNKLKYIKIEYSEDASNNYTLSNTTLLKSVPYALYAEKTNLKAGVGIKVDGSTISNTGDQDNDTQNEIQNLSINGNTLAISKGNSVQLPGSGTGSSMQILTTDEILALNNKPQGTMILSSTNNAIYYYAGSNWFKLESTIQQSGNDVVVNDCLVAYYNFDNDNGNDYNNEYNGTIKGVVFTTDVNSKINKGKSASFDGNDRITVAKNPLKDLTQGTISFWIKSSAAGNIIYGHTGTSQAFQIKIQSNLGKKQLWFNEGSYFDYDITPYVNNSWNHLVVTISNSERKLYANGLLLETDSNNQGMTWTNLNNGMLIGERESWAAYSYTGKIDNLRIHCRPLTENEVKQIYNAGQ